MAKKIGRNDPCPCGSGRKYKNCCGASGDLKIARMLSEDIKRSDLALENFVLERLSEDTAFIRDAIQNIIGPSGFGFCEKFADGLKAAYLDDGLREFVENDGRQIFAARKDADKRLIREVRPYENTVPAEEEDIVSLYRKGHICAEGMQVELFHRYLMQNLKNRFDDYLYVPSEKAIYGQELGSFARRGFDILLGITLYIELQLGVHVYFSLVNKWEFPSEAANALKVFFELGDVPLTEKLDTGLGLMLAGYKEVIDYISTRYNAEDEIELYHSIGAYSEKVYPNRRDMIKSEYYSPPQRYDYISYLRLLVPATCFNSGGLYAKARFCFPQCDLIKYLCGLEEIVALFEDRAEEMTVSVLKELSEEQLARWNRGEDVTLEDEQTAIDRKAIYHNAVFWFMDEMNGMVHSGRPSSLVYEDFAGINEDEFTVRNEDHDINPARKSTYVYSMRKLRMEIYDAFNGKNFTLRTGDGPGSLEGLRFTGSYPILPWVGSGKEDTYHIRPFDRQGRDWEDLYSEDIRKRQEYLTLEYRLTTIPVNCIGLYLNPDVFYGWEERNQLLRLTRKKNALLRQANEDLNRHIELNHELVRSLYHSSANYLDSDRLARTGIELHGADGENPTVDRLHMEGLSLLLQSEQEMFLTRQLKSLYWRCSADVEYLTAQIRGGLSKTEGVGLGDPAGFALKTVIARVLFRDDDVRAAFIRKKLGRDAEGLTHLKSSFMLDILAGASKADVIGWWNANIAPLSVETSPVWEKLLIRKDKAFYDLVTEMTTELVFNALSHGEISGGIRIRFGQAEELLGVPRWAYMECVNTAGERYEGGTKAGISTLNETVRLLNNGKRGIETKAEGGAFAARIWLLSSLLKP